MSKAGSFEEVLGQIEAFQTATHIPWYRGCSRIKYDLLPKIARGPKGTRKFSDVQVNETKMFREFRERSITLQTGHAHDQWDTMFIMQHYGVPTRLLDWSESPFVALFFALSPRPGGYIDDPVIWMVDPQRWNQSVMPFSENDERILDKAHRRLGDYGFDIEIERYRSEPLMIKGSHNSPRIVAQRGCFTVFGKQFVPLQKFAADESVFPTGVLQNIIIDKSQAHGIFQSLVKKGISETFVYPDMEGLSLEVARKHGFSND